MEVLCCGECGVVGHVVCKDCYDEMKFRVTSLQIESHKLHKMKKKYLNYVCKTLDIAEVKLSSAYDQTIVIMKLHKKIMRLKEQLREAND